MRFSQRLSLRRLTICLLAVAACAVPISADDLQFTKSDSETVRAALELIRTQHLEHPAIDDQLSEKLLVHFIDVWDPAKVYFTQSDVHDFRKSQHVLDDRLQSGNMDFAIQVLDRFTHRQHELKPVIERLIDANHDFETDETIATDPEELNWTATEDELQERWRKRIKHQLLSLRLDGESAGEAKQKLHQRYRDIRSLTAQTSAADLMEFYLTSLLECLDPHSGFLSPRSKEDFDINMALELQGIGARLQYSDGDTVVMEVIAGGPAAVDGRLQQGDTITGVAQGSDGAMVDVVGRKLDRVVALIRGPVDSVVRLKVRKKSGESAVYDLMRQKIRLSDRQASGVVISASEWFDGETGRIGVLNIPSFYRDFQGAASGRAFKSTAGDVRRILTSFREQNVDAVIVDLRTNGGGALPEAVEVSGLFIPQGPVVQMQGRDKAISVLSDDDPDMIWRGPVVVLCSRLSASAAEIFAGAIHDYRRGIIVGDSTTHGKGTVQNMMNVTNGLSAPVKQRRGVLKLTVGRWYRVSGDGAQIAGIRSDIALPSTLDVLHEGERELDNPIPFDRIRRADFLPFSNYVTPEIITSLRSSSTARISTSEDFQKRTQRMEVVKQRKQRREVTLRESSARQQQKLLESLSVSGDELEPVATDAATGRTDVFPDSAYNREVLQITVDYVQRLKPRA